ncbi:MAG: hypothetical protein K2X25_16100 [Caulobacteraceae bacterium]|nr:hypothetical protein [Caulobacteraceae bacterium]
MRFQEPVHMSDDHASPVWARTKRRSGGGAGGFVGLLVTLLALFGVLTAVLGIKERSLAEGGALLDGWITAGVDRARALAGQAPEAADAAVETAGEAAGATGEALESGAATAAQDLKQQ